MAPQRSSRQTDPPTLGAQSQSHTRVYKRRHTTAKSFRRKDGLLDATSSLHSDLMHIAQQNSLQSPLLRLPGELRDKIWRFALGDCQIDIQHLSHEEPVDPTYDMRTLYPDTLCPSGFVRPIFQLPRVCRQIYTEASPYVYTLNTFTFHSMRTFDRWIKNRCVGQKRLITSLDVPRTYARLYRNGFRRSFKSKFPNIRRIGIDNWSLFFAYDEIRHLPENKGRGAIDMWFEVKAKIIAEVQDKEGQDVCIGWHGQSA